MYPFNRRKILCEEAGSFFIMALLMILFLPNLLQAKSNILKESLATIQAKALKGDVIEHNPQILSNADWILELGPGAGKEGGRVKFPCTLWHVRAALQLWKDLRLKILQFASSPNYQLQNLHYQ